MRKVQSYQTQGEVGLHHPTVQVTVVSQWEALVGGGWSLAVIRLSSRQATVGRWRARGETSVPGKGESLRVSTWVSRIGPGY